MDGVKDELTFLQTKHKELLTNIEELEKEYVSFRDANEKLDKSLEKFNEITTYLEKIISDSSDLLSQAQEFVSANYFQKFSDLISQHMTVIKASQTDFNTNYTTFKEQLQHTQDAFFTKMDDVFIQGHFKKLDKLFKMYFDLVISSKAELENEHQQHQQELEKAYREFIHKMKEFQEQERMLVKKCEQHNRKNTIIIYIALVIVIIVNILFKLL